VPAGGGLAVLIRVRAASPEDADALRLIYRRASLSSDRDRENLLANPSLLEWSDAPIAEGRTVVAEGDGVVAGFATWRAVGDEELELDALFVDPEWRRRRAATVLVEDVLRIAGERGSSAIVVTANPDALAFYRSVGFEEFGTAETTFGPAPRMRLRCAAK